MLGDAGQVVAVVLGRCFSLAPAGPIEPRHPSPGTAAPQAAAMTAASSCHSAGLGSAQLGAVLASPLATFMGRPTGFDRLRFLIGPGVQLPAPPSGWVMTGWQGMGPAIPAPHNRPWREGEGERGTPTRQPVPRPLLPPSSPLRKAAGERPCTICCRWGEKGRRGLQRHLRELRP